MYFLTNVLISEITVDFESFKFAKSRQCNKCLNQFWHHGGGIYEREDNELERKNDWILEETLQYTKGRLSWIYITSHPTDWWDLIFVARVQVGSII